MDRKRSNMDRPSIKEKNKEKNKEKGERYRVRACFSNRPTPIYGMQAAAGAAHRPVPSFLRGRPTHAKKREKSKFYMDRLSLAKSEQAFATRNDTEGEYCRAGCEACEDGW